MGALHAVMTESFKGVAAMIAACVVWGLSPLFYAQFSDIPTIDILAHRTLWSLLLFAGVLMFQRRLSQIPKALSTPKNIAIITTASVMIAINWGLFIWATKVGRVTETSLGYYIFPLVAVVLGMLAFGEKLSRAQALAVGLAVVAVSVLAIGTQTPPWIALALAVTFGIYGLIKKRLEAGPVVSVACEVLLFAPLAAVWLIWFGDLTVFGNLTELLFLALCGPMTAIPLMFFSYATKRVRLGTVGLVQYLNPTLQFVCAVLIFKEPFGVWHGVAFALIWTALALYSAASLPKSRAHRAA
jgi:chloramphenicol-sensitive protein RarD